MGLGCDLPGLHGAVQHHPELTHRGLREATLTCDNGDVPDIFIELDRDFDILEQGCLGRIQIRAVEGEAGRRVIDDRHVTIALELGQR